MIELVGVGNVVGSLCKCMFSVGLDEVLKWFRVVLCNLQYLFIYQIIKYNGVGLDALLES